MYLLIKYICLSHGGIGEGVNTVDCGSIMHRFESDIPPQNGKKVERLIDRNRFL